MSVTIQTVRQESAKLVGAFLASGTATAGSTTTLVDTSTATNSILQSSLSNGVERFKGGFLLMTGGANAAAWRIIADDAPGTGTATAAKPFANSIQAGDTYEIYAALNPDQWIDAIQAGLTRCQYLSKSPITLVTDGDMEAGGTTAWSATNATIAKSTSDAVTEGAQSLVVTNTLAGGYVTQATNLACTPNVGFRLWVDYRVVSAAGETAQVAVWDMTNNKAIQAFISPDADSGKSTQGGLISVAFSIPSGCYRMQIRLGGVESTAVIAWDDLVLYCLKQFRYVLPSWLSSREQYSTLLQREGSGPLDYEWPDVQWPLNIEEDPTAATVFRCNLPKDALVRPVYLHGERAYAPLTTTTDATSVSANIEWLKWETAAAAHEYFGQALSHASLARERADKADCEVRCVQLRSIFRPNKETRLGFSKPWRGSRTLSMP